MDFSTQKQKFFNRLGESCYMVLATCQDNYPLASTMTCLIYDDAIWMQTDKKFPKYDQILNNNKVALCISATQIEGTASFCGHPNDKDNEKFVQMLKKHHPQSYAMYSGVDTQVVIKVKPLKVIDWLYEAGASEIIHLNFETQTVEVQHYKNSK